MSERKNGFPLFGQELQLLNLGLESFLDGPRAGGTAVVQVDWRPPLPVDPDLARVIRAEGEAIDCANRLVLERIQAARPHLVGLSTAREVVPGMTENTFLHAGPPITWERTCGPMGGAILGALLYEGRADTPERAAELAASGKLQFAPCHEHAAVGPMAGVISPSMPVFVVREETFGGTVFATMNEGLGKVLRYGAYGPEVLTRLRWMASTLYPALRRALEANGPIDLRSLIAQALHMGDEVHNRNRAATSLLFRALAPALARTAPEGSIAAEVLDFINGNDHFFLNLSMASCKAMLDTGRDMPGSSVVVAMARNGTDFGVQLAGTGGRWYTGPAEVPDALFFPGYTRADANPDIGDSSITETNGLGGFSIAASPAIVQFVGGTPADALDYTLQMYEITAAESNVFQIPALGFRGSPVGIDVRLVVDKNILPFIDTGVAHREPGIGQVGAGVLNAPAEPFVAAYEGLASHLAGTPRA